MPVQVTFKTATKIKHYTLPSAAEHREQTKRLCAQSTLLDAHQKQSTAPSKEAETLCTCNTFVAGGSHIKSGFGYKSNNIDSFRDYTSSAKESNCRNKKCRHYNRRHGVIYH